MKFIAKLKENKFDYKSRFSNYKEQLLSLIYPKYCFNCGEHLDPCKSIYLCSDCWDKVNCYIEPPFCTACGRPIKIYIIDQQAVETCSSCWCADCEYNNYNFSKGYTASLYEGPIKDYIYKFKYNSCTYLAGTLSRLMIDFAGKHIDIKEIDVLVPVPLHWSKLRERGYNQSELLAKDLSKAFNIPVITNSLKRIKNVKSQTELPRKKRIENVKDIFKVTRTDYFSRKRILMIDDVFTTGATLNECSKVLKEIGAEDVRVFTLARGVSS